MPSRNRLSPQQLRDEQRAVEALLNALPSLMSEHGESHPVVLSHLARTDSALNGLIPHLDFSTPKDGAVCWSYREAAYQLVAKSYAARHGGMTIEQTAGGAWLESLNLQAHHNFAVWEKASHEFGRQATGTVHVFAPVRPSEKSLFVKVEVPALQDTARVPMLLYHSDLSKPNRVTVSYTRELGFMPITLEQSKAPPSRSAEHARMIGAHNAATTASGQVQSHQPAHDQNQSQNKGHSR